MANQDISQNDYATLPVVECNKVHLVKHCTLLFHIVLIYIFTFYSTTFILQMKLLTIWRIKIINTKYI